MMSTILSTFLSTQCVDARLCVIPLFLPLKPSARASHSYAPSSSSSFFHGIGR